MVRLPPGSTRSSGEQPALIQVFARRWPRGCGDAEKRGEAELGIAAGLEGVFAPLDTRPLFTEDFAAQLVTKKKSGR